MRILFLFFAFLCLILLVSCNKQIKDHKALGEFLCDCYSKQIAKQGVHRGKEICDSMARKKNKLYDIFWKHNTTGQHLSDDEESSYPTAREFEAQVQLYIGDNCEGYFWKKNGSCNLKEDSKSDK